MKLIADMHTHTCVSHHAYSTVSEMCAAAYQRGYKAIAITDHAPAMPDSAHLWHFLCMNELPRMVQGVFLIRGAEVNILNEKGNIDLDETALSALDFVIASFHKQTFPEPTFEKCTEALEHILENPRVHLLAHLGTPRFAFHYEHIISQCARYSKAVELNGSSPEGRPGSRERCIEIAKLCNKYSVPVFIDSDAHFCGNLNLSENAVEVAREAGLDEELIINADWDRLCEYLKRHCGVDPRKETAK